VKWEYLEVYTPRKAVGQAELNTLGAEGWELVNIVAPSYTQPLASSNAFVAYMKRPKS